MGKPLGVVLLAVLALAAPASAHLSHARQDEVTLTAAQERAYARKTKQVTMADVAAAAEATADDPGLVGRWGAVTSWPVVGIHVALLVDGRVLAYDSVRDAASETYDDHNTTRATIWDPQTGAQTPATVTTGFNIFCSGLAHLADGLVFVAGGNKDRTLAGLRKTHVFDIANQTWTLTADMATERWYPSVTPLANGEMLITDGTSSATDKPEVRATNGAIRSLTGAGIDLPLYPWLDVAPDGRTVYSGPSTTLRALSTSGNGSWTSYGTRDAINRTYGSRAMYDVGRLLVAGGGSSSKTARTINISSSSPSTSATGNMAYGRRQHNLTVLPDGSVLATGGNSSGAELVDLANGVYAAELWKPSTGAWTTLASESVTRQYHSTALLLPDGRVLSSGGGICGTCTTVGYLAKNAQVFTPPYLFKKDASGELAPRPAITAAPASVRYGAAFEIQTSAQVGKVSLVRVSAVTHSVNMEQRYVPLTFSSATGKVTATAPANANIAPPGYYLLTVVDSAGVPSLSKMLRVTTGTNAAPSVIVTAPGAGASFAAPASYTLSATASDSDGSIAKVEFFRDATPVGTDTTAPYSVSDAGVPAGSYALTARATDNEGAATTSAPVAITVTAAPSAPIATYAFDEGSGTTTADRTGNGNAGALGGATWSAGGHSGSALSFDGDNDWVTIADSNALDLTGPFTLEAWVNPRSLKTLQTVLLKESGSTLGYGMYATRWDGAFPSGWANEAPVFDAGSISADRWTHLALTYDGGTLRLYRDGAPTGTVGGVAAPAASSGPLRIGGNGVWSGEWFDGLIDDVRVYGRALSAAEVVTDRDTPVAPPPGAAGPVLALDFDETGGLVAHDSSGHGHDGTLSGVSFTSGGYRGGALSAGAGGYVTVADHADLDVTGALTLEARVRPRSTKAWQTVLFKESATDDDSYALYGVGDGGGAASAWLGFTSLAAPSLTGVDRWTHLAYTLDGGTARMYVDGALVATRAGSGPAVPSAGPLRIGGNSLYTGEWFDGYIDEVRVWPRALSASEVAARAP